MGWYRIEALMAGFRIVMIDERPKKVLVERRGDLEIHYFYWDLDLYKPFDYEPVTVLGSLPLSLEVLGAVECTCKARREAVGQLLPWRPYSISSL